MKCTNFTSAESSNRFLPLFSPSILTFREKIVSFIFPLLFASSFEGFERIDEGGGEKGRKKRFDLFSHWVKLF